MTLQQMMYAVKIAETKSMNKAAGELYISQPALSSAIHEMEEELQITLFIRTKKGVIVTTEGETFLGYARQMVELSDMIRERSGRGGTQEIQRFHAALLLCGGSLYEAGEGICPFGL